MEDSLDKKEAALLKRLEKIKALEKETIEREKALKTKEKSKKQIVLRLSPSLWEELASWAEDDYRSINGQIEYLLTDCVRRRKNKKDL